LFAHELFTGALIGLEVFTQTAITTMGMFWLLWGLSLISLSFFFSTLVNSKSAASMLGYVVALGGPLFATLLALGVYVVADTPMPTAWFIWPQVGLSFVSCSFFFFLVCFEQFAMVRGIYLITKACTFDNICYGNVWHVNWNDEMAAVLGMLAFDAVLYFVLFLYLDQVLPKTFGISKHPLFCFQPLMRLCRGRRRDYDHLVEGEEPHAITVDSDVAAEEALVDSLNAKDDRYPLVIKHLCKRYDGSAKVAVRDLSLAVGTSQVLGLLGENGAGKTTTIAMLTGLYAPTSGDAFVNGNSIVQDIDRFVCGMLCRRKKERKEKKKKSSLPKCSCFHWSLSSVQHSLGQSYGS
jgi:ABC-type multidrug transport system fused ATPase/permease subunit